uniref:WH1 domain-containing protein n=1 Tax=Anopheles farauti TaxID=69004 RepID=A0A182QMB6_9DIPT
MTEAYEDDFLVRVRAQVMARDESTEGWLPLQGGGLANVSIRKRARLPPDGGGHEYIIYGQRISDQTVILSCVINRDLQYFKVMPTFHHWRAGKQRNGLTFQTAADARAFDKGIIRAYDDLIDGEQHTNRTYSNCPGPVAMTDRRESYAGQEERAGEQQKPCDLKLKYNFYHLKVHDYNYPVIEEPPIGGSLIGGRRDSTTSLKKRNALDAAANAGATSVPPIMKEGTLIKTRLRCRYCQEFYNDEWNHKGSCDYAPDCFRTAIENVSGMPCARCMLYHCMKDSEGETAAHPCLCTGESGCTKRWIGLALLSLVVPCLWCYPPLRACHWIGVSCRLCGGKHKPQI